MMSSLYFLGFVWQVLKQLDGLRDPLPSSKHNFYILIETTGSMESHDK